MVLEIFDDGESSKADIQPLNTGSAFPSVNTVMLSDLKVVEVDTTDLIGHYVTINKADYSQVEGKVVNVSERMDGSFTLNQARGVNSYIDDRFDLTLECIRLYYLGQKSPLYDTLLRYQSFFDLFTNFQGYVKFFLLDDLVTEDEKIKFYLPFDNFQSKATISDIDKYRLYKNGVLDFIKARNQRIEDCY